MAKRILVIDSDESFANVLAGAISKSGLSPLVATNSEQGMTLAKQESPDLIVVCVEAQPTNGYMLCTRLKKDDKLKSIPVVLTSANATPDSFEKHKKLKTRAEEYLIKPFQPAALLEKVSALLGVEIPGAGEAAQDDESLGLGNLAAEDDEPISLTDDDVNGGPHEPVLDDVEEVVQLEETVAEGDSDLDMFDQAFESLKPVEPAPLERPHLRLAPEPEPSQEAALADEPLLAPTEVSAPSDDQVLAGLSEDEDLPVAAPEDDETLLDEPEAVVQEPETAVQEPEPVIDEPEAVIDGSEEVIDEPRVEQAVHADGEMGDLLEAATGLEDEALTGPARSDLEARIAELEMALADKSADLETARQSSPSAELQRLKEARNRQEKELLRLREEVHEKDKQLLALEEQQTELEAQAQQLRDEAKKRDSATKALQQRADALAAAAKKLERDLAAAREELKSGAAAKTRAAEAEKLRTQLAEANSRCESLQTEMTGVRELHESEVSALKADLEKARAEMDAVRAEAAEAVASAGQNEERAVKAYQKIKNDEKLREKTRKALEIALALLQDNAVEPAEESAEREKKSA